MNAPAGGGIQGSISGSAPRQQDDDEGGNRDPDGREDNPGAIAAAEPCAIGDARRTVAGASLDVSAGGKRASRLRCKAAHSVLILLGLWRRPSSRRKRNGLGKLGFRGLPPVEPRRRAGISGRPDEHRVRAPKNVARPYGSTCRNSFLTMSTPALSLEMMRLLIGCSVTFDPRRMLTAAVNLSGSGKGARH